VFDAVFPFCAIVPCMFFATNLTIFVLHYFTIPKRTKTLVDGHLITYRLPNFWFIFGKGNFSENV